MTQARSDTIWQGLVAGLIGYASVALAVGIGDALQGRSFFYTVSLLGGWLFHGRSDPANVLVWPGAVFAYNGLHLLTFLAFGLAGSWLANVAERGPLFWYGSLVLYLMVFIHLFAGVVQMTEPMRGGISLLQVTIPSLLAVMLMSAYLLRMHPLLRREMNTWEDNADELAEEHDGPAKPVLPES
jgi:hypothetical protein